MSGRKAIYRIRAGGRGASMAREAASKLELYRRLLQAANRVFRLAKSRKKLVAIKTNGRAARTGELAVLLDPTDRLLRLTLAIRALDREIVRVKKPHVGSPGVKVGRSRSNSNTRQSRRHASGR